VKSIRPWLIIVILVAIGIGVYLAVTHLGERPEKSAQDTPQLPRAAAKAPAKQAASQTATRSGPSEAAHEAPVGEQAHGLGGTILDAQSQPVRDAEVIVLLVGQTEPPVLKTRTDQAGRFAFSTVPGKTFDLFVRRESGSPPWHLDEIDPSSKTARWLAGLKFTLEAERQTWSALVTNGEGEPIAGASVTLLVTWLEGLKAEELCKTFSILGWTDANGLVTFTGLDPSGYAVTVRKAGYGLWHDSDVSYEGAHQQEPLPIVLTPGESVSGRVLDPDGHPFEGAEVTCHPMGRYWVDLDVPLASTESGPDGRFTLADVPAGRRLLVASSARFAPGCLSGLVVAPATGADSCELRLGRGGVVEGLVVGASGVPIAGATVSLTQRFRGDTRSPGRLVPTSTGSSELVLPVAEAATGADGTFRFDTAPARGAWADTSKDGFGGSRPIAVSWEKPVRIVLVQRPAVTGVVTVAETGKPAEGATVYSLFSEEKAQTDAEGKYRLDIYSGLHTFVACAPGLATRRRSRVLVRSGTVVELNLTLEPSREVRGVVVDAATGEAIAEAAIMAVSDKQKRYWKDEGDPPFEYDEEPFRDFEPDSPFHAESDETGAFSIPLVTPDKNELFVDAEDYLSVRVPLTESTAGGPLRIELARGASIAGQVLSPQGEPLPGAEVYCYVVHLSTGQGRRESGGYHWSMATSKETDEQGRFYFGGLGPGRCLLWAFHSDYVDMRLDPFTLRADETLDGISMLLPLGGRVTGTLTDEDGRPVQEAGVECTPADESPSRESPSGDDDDDPDYFRDYQRRTVWTESGTDGEYTSPPLAPRLYTVSVESRSHVCDTEHRVLVTSGGTADHVDFVLQEGAVITGRVVDADGKPVADAGVTTYQRGYRSAETDENGEFALRGLSPGECEVEVSAEGFLEYDHAHVAPLDGLEIKLDRGSTIAGRVVDKDTGTPVEVFDLTVRQEEAGSESSPPDVFDLGVLGSGDAHPEGRFERAGLEPGTYAVTICSEHYAPGVVRGIEVAPGAEPGEIVIELVRGASVWIRVTSAADGRPVRDAVLMSKGEAQDYGLYRAAYGYDEEYFLTGADGTCLIEHVSPGRYEFVVATDAFVPTEAGFELLEGENRKEVDVSLERGLALRGRVVARGLRRPVQGASLRLEPRGKGAMYKEHEAETDEAGAFAFETILAGAYTLYLWHPDFAPLSQRVVLGPDLSDEVVIELGVGGQIVGRVATADGLPVERAEVSVQYDDTSLGFEQQEKEVTTDASGNYVVRRLPPGRYKVTLTPPDSPETRGVGRAVESKRALAQEGDTARVDFVVHAGAAVFGTVTRAGEPAADSSVHVTWKGRSLSTATGSRGYARADDNGQYRVEDLRPGHYELEVYSRRKRDGYSGYSGRRREFDIGTEDVRIDIGLDGATFSGVVLDTAGSPIEGAWVLLVQVAAQPDRTAAFYTPIRVGSGSSETDENGAFRIVQVSAGTHLLEVEKDGYASQILAATVQAGTDVSDVVVRLTEESVVTGRAVIPERDGEMPKEVFVSVLNERQELLGTSYPDVDAETGRFRIDGLGAGRFTLLAQATGYAPVRTAVNIGPATETSLDFKFTRGRTLTVTVLDDAGAHVPAADVILDAGDDPRIFTSLVRYGGGEDHVYGNTNAEGTVLLRNVAEGQYTVRVRCPGYEDAAVPARIAGRDGEVTVTLKPGGAEPD